MGVRVLSRIQFQGVNPKVVPPLPCPHHRACQNIYSDMPEIQTYNSDFTDVWARSIRMWGQKLLFWSVRSLYLYLVVDVLIRL